MGRVKKTPDDASQEAEVRPGSEKRHEMVTNREIRELGCPPLERLAFEGPRSIRG